MFVFRKGDAEISILRDAEFRNLSDDEKLKYFWGPDEAATCNWIKDVIRSNDTGDIGLPEITERFVKEMFWLVCLVTFIQCCFYLLVSPIIKTTSLVFQVNPFVLLIIIILSWLISCNTDEKELL